MNLLFLKRIKVKRAGFEGGLNHRSIFFSNQLRLLFLVACFILNLWLKIIRFRILASSRTSGRHFSSKYLVFRETLPTSVINPLFIFYRIGFSCRFSLPKAASSLIFRLSVYVHTLRKDLYGSLLRFSRLISIFLWLKPETK